MRLWSIHPKYLDKAWLLACWREWLLAKKVLEWNTKWYKNHPQLLRFKETQNSILAINSFLSQIYLESKNRWYKFQIEKIEFNDFIWIIKVTEGQLRYEMSHLLKKLQLRDTVNFEKLKNTSIINSNPVFEVIPWEIETWERL